MARRTPRGVLTLAGVSCSAFLALGALSVVPAGAASATPRAAVGPAYTFLNPPDGTDPTFVTRWNPCAPIRVGVDTAYLKTRGIKVKKEVARIRSVVREAAKVSGYSMVFKGRVDNQAYFEDAATSSDPQFPDLVSGAYSAAGGLDIVITYARDSGAGAYTYPAFSSGAWGYGEAFGATNHVPGSSQIAIKAYQGSVVLNANGIKQSLRQNRPGQIRNLYLHELGHALGLGHTTNYRQVMYPSVRNTVTHYRAGDRAGLRALESAPCFSS